MIAQSTEKIEFEGKEYTRYEATQLQRRIETKMRQCKDRAILAKAAGDDLTRKVEQLRLNQLKQKYGEITTLFKTPPALDRAAVSGFRPVSVKGFEVPKVAKAPEVKLPDYSPDLQKANEGKLFNIFSNETDVVSRIPIDFSDRYGEAIGKIDSITFDEYRKTHVIRGHTEQLKWIMENQDKIVQAIHNPLYVDKAPRTGERKSKNIAHIISIQDEETPFFAVVLNIKGNTGKVFTIFKAVSGFIIDGNGELLSRWTKLKK